MKIVSTALKNKQDILGAFTAILAENFLIWYPDIKPVFDMIEEVQPNVILCEAEDIDSTFLRAIKENPDIDLVIFGVGTSEDVLSVANNIVICPPANTPPTIRKNIDQCDSTVLYVAESANMAQIFNGVFNKDISTDILYVSNVPTMDKTYILPILSDIYQQKKQIKVVGEYSVPLPFYLGSVRTVEISSLLSSSKIVLDFDGTMLLDAAINKAFVISNTINGLYPHYDNIDSLRKLIEYYLENDELRKTKANMAYNKVIKSDTSFHRVSDIFKALNLTELQQLSLDKIEGLI